MRKRSLTHRQSFWARARHILGSRSSPIANDAVRRRRSTFLGLESLEPRYLLSVGVVSEQFMTVGFTSTGSFHGQTILSYPESGPYVDNYHGNSTDQGSITYTSATTGHGTIQGTGDGGGVDNYHPDAGDQASYSFTYEGSGDLEDDNGILQRANAHGQSTTGSGGTPYTLDTVGTVDVSSAPYQAQTSWSFPIHDEFGGSGTSSGSWSGTITPNDNDPFDIEVYAASWMSYGGAVFSFATNGGPYATAARSAPVAKIELYWALGENEESIIGESLGDIPVYWNEAGGAGSLTTLGDIPEDAQYLLVVADHAHKIDEPNRGNNVFALEIYQDPTVQIVVDPDSPKKGENYQVTVSVTNNSAVPMTLDLDWEEIYPNEGIGLVPNQPGTDTESTGELKSQETKEVKLRPLNHYWKWIPSSNPIDGEGIIGSVVSGLQDIKLDELTERFARINGFLSTLGKITTGFEVLQQLAEAHRVIEIPIQVTASDANELVSTTEEQDVELSVPEEYRWKYDSFVAANFIAGQALNAGMKVLFTGNFLLATAMLGGAAGLYIVAGNLYNAAVDPPDPNYTPLAEPQHIHLAGTEDRPTSFDALRAFDGLDLNALSGAESSSRDRADGAKMAEDWQWQSQQMLRASGFASQSALLYTRQIGRDILNEPFASQDGGPTSADIIASLQTEGLPAVMVDVLTNAGWSATRIESLRQNLIASGPELGPKSDEGQINQVAAMNAGGAALGQLEQAVAIRVDKLAAPVRDLTAEERTNLDQMHAAVEETFATNAPSLAALSKIDALLAETRRLMLDTNNVADLHADLDYAYGALSDFQKFDWTPQGLRQHVNDLHAAGLLGDPLADELRGEADTTAAELLDGDFVAAGRTLTSFYYSVRVASDVTPTVQTQLIDYAFLLRDFLDPFPWQNDLKHLDVNGDAEVSPIDALKIINWLNANGGEVLPSPLDTLIPPPAQLDTNGDNVVAPIDALLVINRLNDPSNTDGESEESVSSALAVSSSNAANRVIPGGLLAIATSRNEESPPELPGTARTEEHQVEFPRAEIVVIPPLLQPVRVREDFLPLAPPRAEDVDALFDKWDSWRHHKL